MSIARIVSGMRPTGRLHLGHLCGVLNNWRVLQAEADCFFFVADWHALTTDYAASVDWAAATREMVITWLAAGIDSQRATLFVQSQVPAHAELHVLLSMICPLTKLMQLPTYKEQKENLQQDLETYGFLGYPLLQSADILAYRAQQVPVGEDQQPHIEFAREIARRVNHLYGRSDAWKAQVKQILATLPASVRECLSDSRQQYQQSGDESCLEKALAAIEALATLSVKQRSILRGYCLYEAEELLIPPTALLTPASRLPGTDGRKMSKSYNNTIDLFDEADVVTKKIARMQTDPARQRRHDKGDPTQCPVWILHQHFSDEPSRQWVWQGCRSADIGCVECKQRVAGHINDTLQPLQDRRAAVISSGEVDAVLATGAARAKTIVEETLTDIRQALRLI